MLQSEDAAALVLPPYGITLLNIRLDGVNIGDKGVKVVAQCLQDSIYLETLLLTWNSISDKGASTIADLMKALPRLQHIYLHGNHIGGTGAALLWNQSIHKCCNLDLDGNDIGDDRPDAFISALNGTINSEYEISKSCQLEVSLSYNFRCSDQRDIHTISKRLPKGVTLITDDDCFKMKIVLERITCPHLKTSSHFPCNIKLERITAFIMYGCSGYLMLFAPFSFNQNKRVGGVVLF